MSAEIKVLMIEDDPDDALLVEEMLEEARGAEFGLTHAERLSEGTGLLGRQEFDVVLLDLSLPDRQGLGTLAGVRTAAPDTPVVVLTVLDDAALALKALQCGAQDYLVKGQDTAESLARSIRYAIARQRMEEALRKTMEWEQESWARQQEMREYRHYVAMSKDTPPVPPWDEAMEEVQILLGPRAEALAALTDDYRNLVLGCIMAAESPEGRPVRRLHYLARRLAELRARARDVVRLHLDTLAEFSRGAEPADYQEFLMESRLVLVELLGALADTYLGACAEDEPH
jgi:DNA-binding NarL/FixJ family response regulator